MTNTVTASRAQRRRILLCAFIYSCLIPSCHFAGAQCLDGSAPGPSGCTAQDISSQSKQWAPPINSQGRQNVAPLGMEGLDTGSTIETQPKSSRRAQADVDQTDLRNRPLPVKPEPPTEFQRFVAASTGQLLPIYGAELFKANPASFGSSSNGPAAGETVVGAEDELRIRVWGQVNFSANLWVSRDGDIYIPKVGAVHVAGLPFSALAAHLEKAMQQVYRNFNLSVDLGHIHSVEIYVTGQAKRPGEYTVSALNTLVDAIFTCGGPSAAGSMRHLLLKRAGKVEADFDLYALLVDGDKTGDIQLQSGDVIYIPPVGSQVALSGSVRQAAIYELRGKETLGKLIETGGGKTPAASASHLSLERITDHSGRTAFDITVDQAGLETVLVDGDIVRVDPILSSFRDTVTLRGGVANPGHFRWHQGMRLSELMPDRDSLEKREYWWLRTQLGLPAPTLAWNVASGNSRFELSEDPTGQSHMDSSALQSLGMRVPRDQKQAPPIKPDAVASPGFETNWNFAVIERLNSETMKTVLIPFALGKLVLDHDMSQDRELQAGDVITIFTQADIQIPIQEQTKYITLEGEFVHPGVYSVSSNDTLRSLVERAGGLTPQAYPYAASFTRKSTRTLEQRQIEEYAQAMEHQLPRNPTSASAAAAGSDLAAGQQAAALNRELVTRVRTTEATGRIVLDMDCHGAVDCTLPDLHLEDGDRLLVPVMPDTVQVIGAVFNPRSFMYHKDATTADYLHLAGGPNRNADRKRMFVLRADGTVLSRDLDGSHSGHRVSQMSLHPGDSVVVPEKGMRNSPLTQALAWTQILSQSSLPAMEAKSLSQ